MSIKEMDNRFIEALMVNALEDFTKNKVDEMIELAVNKFKHDIEEKRMEMI